MVFQIRLCSYDIFLPTPLRFIHKVTKRSRYCKLAHPPAINLTSLSINSLPLSLIRSLVVLC